MEFIYHFAGVFEPAAFGLLLLGTIGGLILGATPGLSPTMTVALLIPFTFHLPPAHGLILLGAAYTSTVAGGAISAILLKIPGAPANIATALDGYAMSQRGEAARALQISFIASVIGGIFGVLLLIFLTPVLARWALAFGFSHLFWLSLLGITIIASLDSKDSIKGLISGCIGLWLAMIGYDDIQGVERFVFHDSLIGGVNIIASLIGLFAIPQAMSLLSGGDTKASMVKIVPYPFKACLKEVMQSGRALGVGSCLGAIIGLIPGVGGQIAGLVAYDQSKKFSKTPEQFGKGHAEGVVAAESANNAMVGPSLVPLLTLSIPGSPTAAVLLGGLLIHGIFPGPNLFQEHADVAWVFIDSMLIGQILMGVFGILLASTAAKIIKVPPSTLAVAIIILSLFGSYAVRQSIGDVYVMFTLGTGMYFLEKFGFSAAPLALGLILGPIAEANFVQGSLIASASDGILTYFFAGTLNITIIGFVFLSIAYSLVSSYKTRKKKETP